MIKNDQLINMWQHKDDMSYRGRRAFQARRRSRVDATFLSLTRHRRGSVTLAVSFGMVVLCGFCALGVDYGRAVLAKNQLQRACDAAALAGAKYLPKYNDSAKTAAVYYAYQNNAIVNTSSGIQITHNNSRIRVRATQNVKYLFAPVMKILNGDVTAQATAAVQQRDGIVPAPIAITPSTYETYKDGSPIVLDGIRLNKDDLGIRDFVLLDLNDSQVAASPSQMQGQLQWGSAFNESSWIGGTETTLADSITAQASHFVAGMQTRLTAAAGPPWYDDGTKFTNIPAGSPRVMIFVVTPEQEAVNGSHNAEVVGFVPVYVESMTIGKHYMQIRARMLPLSSLPGGDYRNANSNDPLDHAPLYITRLID
jgi:Flp pilus assembly protein TadG